MDVGRARAAFPEIRGDAEAFAAHVATCQGARAEHLAELYVAWAAGCGDPVAIRHLERALEPEVLAAARRIDRSLSFVDEVRQALRVRLLVGEPPKIHAYAGRGPLGRWLAVAALRVALNLRRADGPAVTELLGELVPADADPELQHLKKLYRAEFREALSAAIAALPERDRTLLRLTYVDGLTMVRVARLYDVHETTAARWVTRAAETVAHDTRRRLTTRLALSPASLDSIARLVLSNLELSISRVLRG